MKTAIMKREMSFAWALLAVVLVSASAFGAVPPGCNTVGPGMVPDYFGCYPNYATSPILPKFVDALPVPPIASADACTYSGQAADCYEIHLREYTAQMHANLPLTKLRGYVQVRAGVDVAPISYLGPVIVATRDKPVRIKFVNELPAGAGGNLFIPTDTTYMGAGEGPVMGENYTQNRATLHLHGGTTPWISDGTPHQWITPAAETATSYPRGVSVKNVPDMGTSCDGPNSGCQTFFYSNQQSARLMFYHDHAYGITRLNVYAGEAAGYLLTDAFEADLINGTNVSGANPGLVMLPGGVTALGTPLVIQDKTFVPDNTTPYTNLIGTWDNQLQAQDPTWDVAAWGGPGQLWFPHVYMPNQNPGDLTGANPMGRWDYGPWFWPPFTGLVNGPIANPYYNPACVSSPTQYCEGPEVPGTPEARLISPSGVPESFMDTPLVNGKAYPILNVPAGPVRFRILNASNDRFLNLQLYQASSIIGGITVTAGGSGYSAPSVVITDPTGKGATVGPGDVTIDPATGAITAIALHSVGSGYTAPTVTITDATGTGAAATATAYSAPTEVGMVAFSSSQNAITPFPASWYTPKNPFSLDDRAGGVPDPRLRGPAMIQIGTEGGFLPAPALIKNQPVNYDYNRRSITVLNVLEKALFLGPAERADVIVDFTNFAGKTLILYNDSPAPVPAADPRLDYYTGDPNQSDTGGAPSTQPGFGPNTRTIMQIVVAGAGGTAPVDDYNPATLAALQTALPAVFAASQDRIVVPQAPYNAVYNATYPGDASAYVRIQDTSFNVINGTLALALTNGGGGYTSVPAVSITGGGGTGATATATLAPGAVGSLAVTNGGGNYTATPTVSFSGGGGTGAVAAAVLAPTTINNFVVSNGGSGYTSAPTVNITGGGGTGATATATISGGRIVRVTVTNPGSGYTSTPVVSFTGGGGTGAVARAILQPTSVASLTLTNGGSGYTSAPTVRITGGAGTGATATATLAGRAVGSLTLTNAGSGYTSAPAVSITGGGGTGALATASLARIAKDLEPKAIIEDFQMDYGRMNAILGNEIPHTNNTNQTSIIQAYVDPPVELVKFSNSATQIGVAADGSQIWKFTHNGVDTHAIHFHLFNVQLINRVGWDGAIKPPDANELGWKETIRMNPLEDAIVALRPIYLSNLPFDLPNSIRPLDVTMPLGSVTGFTGVAPNGNPTTVTNELTNFGWEYVYHCHLLGHEENDMMRPVAVAVPPRAPGRPVATVQTGAVALTWRDNSRNETSFTIQRAPATTGPWTTIATMTSTTGPTVGNVTYTDTTVASQTAYSYRVLASNTVGSTTPGYPTMTVDSPVSPPSAVVTTN